VVMPHTFTNTGRKYRTGAVGLGVIPGA